MRYLRTPIPLLTKRKNESPLHQCLNISPVSKWLYTWRRRRQPTSEKRKKSNIRRKRLECEEQQKKKLAEKEKRTKELAEKRAQRGRRGAQGRGQTSVRAQTCRQDPSDSDDSLTGSSDSLSHHGRSCRQGVQQQTNSHVTQDVESSTSKWQQWELLLSYLWPSYQSSVGCMRFMWPMVSCGVYRYWCWQFLQPPQCGLGVQWLCLIFTDHSCHPNTHAFQFQLCNGCILHLTMHLTFLQNCTQS